MQFYKEIMKCKYPKIISFTESNKNNENPVPIQFLESILYNYILNLH